MSRVLLGRAVETFGCGWRSVKGRDYIFFPCNIRSLSLRNDPWGRGHEKGTHCRSGEGLALTGARPHLPLKDGKARGLSSGGFYFHSKGWGEAISSRWRADGGVRVEEKVWVRILMLIHRIIHATLQNGTPARTPLGSQPGKHLSGIICQLHYNWLCLGLFHPHGLWASQKT